MAFSEIMKDMIIKAVEQMQIEEREEEKRKLRQKELFEKSKPKISKELDELLNS